MAFVASNTRPAPTEIPLAQNTAPVIEFRCLFTSDLRRKQKRWQDGRLKFHTFNKRVMVYDERLNYVGDTHWRDNQLEEGEELELDQGAVLVQVADCLGSRDQDLTELLEKRTKRKEEKAAARVLSSSPIPPPFDGIQIARQPAGYAAAPQKTLKDLLGTPTVRHGKALPSSASPFEVRQAEKGTGELPSKRRKIESTYMKAGYAQNLTGATLDLSSTPHSTRPFRCKSLLTQAPKHQDSSKEDTVAVELQVGRNVSSKDSLESPRHSQRQRKPQDKRAKSTYVQNLTGAVLDLSSAKNANSNLSRHLLPARNTTTGAAHEGGSDTGLHERLRNKLAHPRALQTSQVETQNQVVAKASRKASHKSGAEDTPASVSKPRTNKKSEVQHQDVAHTLNRSQSLDDEFIDIEAIEQANKGQISPTIGESNYGLETNIDDLVISISRTLEAPSPEPPNRPITTPAVESSEHAPDRPKSPSKTAGAIRLKSRPKRKMLVFTHRVQPQPPSVSRSAYPVEAAILGNPQTTRRLDSSHAAQKGKERVRIGGGKATIAQGDKYSVSVSDTEREGAELESQGGNSTVSALPSDVSLPSETGLGATHLLSDQSIPETRGRPDHSTVSGALLHLQNDTRNVTPLHAPESSIPQSSDPTFEHLEKVADRMSHGGRAAVRATPRKRTVPIKPQIMPQGGGASWAGKADRWMLWSGHGGAF